jgi:signal transduction histidine kinase
MEIKKIIKLLSPYLLSFALVAISAELYILIFDFTVKQIIFLIFLPGIILSGWYGGLKSGILTTCLSSLAIYYFFTSVNIIELIIFTLEGIVISYFSGNSHRYEGLQVYKDREKKTQETIEKLHKEISNANQDIALRDEFLSIASHELKTPLTTVVLHLQSTLHNIRNVSLSEFSVEHLLKVLQSMQNQTNRLSKMINDLLNISLITTHKMELELDQVDLSTLVQDIVDNFKIKEKYQRESSRINLNIKNGILGTWDKLRLEQALDNLISNALKYGNNNPIIVELERQNSTAVIKIIDQGIGIKPSEIEKIFSLFKRGNVEKDYKGLGIGLYIASNIIALHGGKIDLKSKPNSGSTFTIYLPIKNN